jgi:hypothetical protein
MVSFNNFSSQWFIEGQVAVSAGEWGVLLDNRAWMPNTPKRLFDEIIDLARWWWARADTSSTLLSFRKTRILRGSFA